MERLERRARYPGRPWAPLKPPIPKARGQEPRPPVPLRGEVPREISRSLPSSPKPSTVSSSLRTLPLPLPASPLGLRCGGFRACWGRTGTRTSVDVRGCWVSSMRPCTTRRRDAVVHAVFVDAGAEPGWAHLEGHAIVSPRGSPREPAVFRSSYIYMRGTRMLPARPLFGVAQSWQPHPSWLCTSGSSRLFV